MEDRQEFVLVLGGYGLIGSAVVRCLLDKGHRVRAVGRDTAYGKRRQPEAEWVSADISKMRGPEDWFDALEGVSVVVNASGALQSGLRDRLGDLQERAVTALVEACEIFRIGRFVQVSAPGAAVSADTEFMRTKGAADDRLRKSLLDWFILKPGLVISTDAYGGTALIRMLAAFPVILPLVKGDSRVGTTSIDDVTEAVVAACEGTIPARNEIAVIEREPHSLTEVVLAFRKWLGFGKPVKVVDLPSSVGRIVSLGADMLGYFGWRSPLRSTAMKTIDNGVVADPSAFEASFGRPARTLDETLARMPSTVQERWFARMYLAMPMVLGTLALFWLVSGIVGAVMLDTAARHLVAAGLGPDTAKAIVLGGAAADITLGAGALFQKTARIACFGMVAVTASYLIAGTVLSPELWADPIGPYVKTIPAAMLALVGAALSRTR